LAGGVLTGDKLDVVDEPEIHAAVGELELIGTRFPQRGDELGGEGLSGEIGDARRRVLLPEAVADGLEEVGFSESRFAVDEEWVIGAAGGGGDGAGGRMGEAIRAADDEAVEGVLLVERHRGESAGDGGG